MRPSSVRRPLGQWSAGLAALGLLLVGCCLVGCCLVGCAAAGPSEPEWPPKSKGWFDRAMVSFRGGDIDDAKLAVERALELAPKRQEVKLLAARVAITELDFDRTLQILAKTGGTDAAGLRGRAYWYSGQVEQAADELEQLLADPEVRDPWALEVSKLARRGVGREPFKMSGGLLAVMEMPRVGSTSLLVPVEVNGEPALALVATGTAEVVIDSSGGKEPSWISLRFGERIEVKDVPALAQDLSGVSKQVNAPIKLLLGVNLLRHLRPTFDFAGGQFVVRSFEPPPPPQATTLHLSYVRGGGMLARGAFGAEPDAPAASLLVDTAMSFPVALDDDGWRKAGVQLASLTGQRGSPLKQGVIPMLRLGAFELPHVPGVFGAPVAQLEKSLNIDLDGLLGSGVMAAFRVTLVDGGRTMWLEDLPKEVLEQQARLAAQRRGQQTPSAPEAKTPRQPEGEKNAAPAPTAPKKPAASPPAPAPATPAKPAPR